MSSGGDSDDRPEESRPALSDITNRYGKRGFSFVWDNSLIKGRNQFGKKYNEEKIESPSWNRPYKSEGSTPTSIIIANGRAKSLLKGTPAINPAPRSSGAGSPSPKEYGQSQFSLSDGGTEQISGKDISLSNLSLSLGTGTSSIDKTDMNKGKSDDTPHISHVLHPSQVSDPSVGRGVCSTIPKDVGFKDSSSCRTIECSRLAQARGSNFRMGKCKSQKADGCSNSTLIDHLIENCSCSFCLKAAFIWSDLQYQDIRGRITAARRSQKDAGILAKDLSSKTENNPCDGVLDSTQSPKFESNLTDQWSSLFRRMEDIFHSETEKLLTEYAAVRMFKDSCKSELESINKKSSDS